MVPNQARYQLRYTPDIRSIIMSIFLSVKRENAISPSNHHRLQRGAPRGDKQAAHIRSLQHQQLHLPVNAAGVNRNIDPFMTLRFMARPVIPTLRITTRGVFDVTTQRYI